MFFGKILKEGDSIFAQQFKKNQVLLLKSVTLDPQCQRGILNVKIDNNIMNLVDLESKTGIRSYSLDIKLYPQQLFTLTSKIGTIHLCGNIQIVDNISQDNNDKTIDNKHSTSFVSQPTKQRALRNKTKKIETNEEQVQQEQKPQQQKISISKIWNNMKNAENGVFDDDDEEEDQSYQEQNQEQDSDQFQEDQQIDEKINKNQIILSKTQEQQQETGLRRSSRKKIKPNEQTNVQSIHNQFEAVVKQSGQTFKAPISKPSFLK